MGATTCIRPSHMIYSHKLQRCLTAAELLGQQGIWASDFLHPDAVQELHTQSTFAREMAGMAFTTTVLQANLLTSIIHCEGWKIVAAEQRGLHVGEPPIPLVAGAAASSRRGGKRKAAGQNGGQESAKKQRADSDRRSQKRKAEGGPAADSDPPASKTRGNNKKGKLISVANKLQIIKRYQEFLGEGSGARKKIEALKLPGYYPGCLTESHWLGSRRSEHWDEFVEQCPQFAQQVDFVPWWFRGVANLPKGPGRNRVVHDDV